MTAKQWSTSGLFYCTCDVSVFSHTCSASQTVFGRHKIHNLGTIFHSIFCVHVCVCVAKKSVGNFVLFLLHARACILLSVQTNKPEKNRCSRSTDICKKGRTSTNRIRTIFGINTRTHSQPTNQYHHLHILYISISFHAYYIIIYVCVAEIYFAPGSKRPFESFFLSLSPSLRFKPEKSAIRWNACVFNVGCSKFGKLFSI